MGAKPLLVGMFVLVVTMAQGEALGQVDVTGRTYGLFGPRTLGRPLTARTPTFGSGGFVTPRRSGQYLGRVEEPRLTPASTPAESWSPRGPLAASELTPTPSVTPPSVPGEMLAASESASTPGATERSAPGGALGASESASTPSATAPSASPPGIPAAGWGWALPRPPIQPDLAYPEFSSRTAETVAKLIEKAARVRKLSPIRVTQQNDTLVLRGRVATRADRDLAENLARLEPGIWNVRNELVVAAEPSEPSAGETPRKAGGMGTQ